MLYYGIWCIGTTLSPVDRLKCLRSKNSSFIVQVQTHYAVIKNGMVWTPTVGNNSLISGQPLIEMAKGNYDTKLASLGGTRIGK